MRIGAKGRPFYRVVAVDERRKRTGGYLELLGTYNPLTKPHEILLKQDLIDAWIKKGAVMSEGYMRIIKQAPQHPERKPKKDRSKEPKAAPAETPAATEDSEAAPAEEVAEETTVETPEVETATESVEETTEAKTPVTEEK